MGKYYIAWCVCGKAVYMAIADSALEQADCARDIKSLSKRGFNVELLESTPDMKAPEWCEDRGKCVQLDRRRIKKLYNEAKIGLSEAVPYLMDKHFMDKGEALKFLGL